MQRICVASKPQQLLLCSLLVWAVGILCGKAAEISAPSLYAATVGPATVGPAICPHRTVNYITHSLAQQCLTRSLPSPAGATEPAANSDSDTPSRISSPLNAALVSAIPHTFTAFAQTAGRRPSHSHTTAITQSTTAIDSEEDSDSDSPLGKDNFLSFEEWKKRNLGKYGQSPEQVGKPKRHDNLHPRRQPIHVLDSLGDDAEIDLNFSAFGSELPQIAVPSHRDAPSAETGGPNQGKEIPKTKSGTKDAGTTCKERFNYASFDCAATVLKTNPKSSGSSAVLVENKDSYMLNECSVENKFLILELCEDILIDTIVLANFEFFSSIFRTFRVSVSDRFPLKADKWKTLGTFEARNTREVQAFLVENPLIWAKYVRIEFLTHYGNEFYCPVSLVRVHGTTMLEDYRHDEDPNKADDREDDEDQVTDTSQTTDTVYPEAVAERLVAEESSKTSAQQDVNLNITESSPEVTKQLLLNTASSFSHRGVHASLTAASENFSRYSRDGDINPLYPAQQQCPRKDGDTAAQTALSANHYSSEPMETPTGPIPSQLVGAIGGTAKWQQQQSSTDDPLSSIDQPSRKVIDLDLSEKSSTIKQSVQPGDTTGSTKVMSAQGSESSKPSASSTQPPPPNPTIQESFFKSVQKRLQMLESNSTLSLQYIEEQSRILRDAFSKVEQRQLSKTTKFLEYLNGTVLNELRDFRQQYDQLWQSTVLELEAQREESRREVFAMNARVGILADELVFQKRMAILQSILVLFCIGLVLFSRRAVNGYLEHPLLQNMLTRSATSRTRGSGLDTPAWSPESTRRTSPYQTQTKAAYHILKEHQRSLSEESQDAAGNPDVAYSLPTSVSCDAQSEVEDREDEHATSESLSQNMTNMGRLNSGPPVVHQAVEEPATPTREIGRRGSRYGSSLSPI